MSELRHSGTCSSTLLVCCALRRGGVKRVGTQAGGWRSGTRGGPTGAPRPAVAKLQGQERRQAFGGGPRRPGVSGGRRGGWRGSCEAGEKQQARRRRHPRRPARTLALTHLNTRSAYSRLLSPSRRWYREGSSLALRPSPPPPPPPSARVGRGARGGVAGQAGSWLKARAPLAPAGWRSCILLWASVLPPALPPTPLHPPWPTRPPAASLRSEASGAPSSSGNSISLAQLRSTRGDGTTGWDARGLTAIVSVPKTSSGSNICLGPAGEWARGERAQGGGGSEERAGACRAAAGAAPLRASVNRGTRASSHDAVDGLVGRVAQRADREGLGRGLGLALEALGGALEVHRHLGGGSRCRRAGASGLRTHLPAVSKPCAPSPAEC